MPFFPLESRSFLTRLRRRAQEFWVHLCIWVCEVSEGLSPRSISWPKTTLLSSVCKPLRSVFSEADVMSPRGPAQVQLVSAGDLVSIPVLVWLVLVVGRHRVGGEPGQRGPVRQGLETGPGCFPPVEVCPGHHCGGRARGAPRHSWWSCGPAELVSHVP